MELQNKKLRIKENNNNNNKKVSNPATKQSLAVQGLHFFKIFTKISSK